jgi:NDP-4-keto-2,6-dideoxyhexose 3-C-methyltransferase
MYTLQTECRICKNKNLVDTFDLGNQYIASRFPSPGEPVPDKIPLKLVKCEQYVDVAETNSTRCETINNCCGLVQLSHNVNSSELYLHNYGYRSGLNNTMTTHLRCLTSSIVDFMSENNLKIEEDDIIVDIGSNDCTLLKSYNDFIGHDVHVFRIGIDPTGTQFKQYYPSDVQLIPKFFSREVINLHECKIITSICMFYDLPDPLQFVRDIKSCLALDGIWVSEQSYIMSMIDTNSFDTICHEHLEYYAYRQIEWMCEKADLRIVDVELNSSNGGSFRFYATHNDNSYVENTDNIQKIKNMEKDLNLQTLINFRNKCASIKTDITTFLDFMSTSPTSPEIVNDTASERFPETRMGESERFPETAIYGASTKGNTLLQYFNIDRTRIKFAAERNPEKFGKVTIGTNIPIVSEEQMRKSNPKFLLALPWHFRDEFISREIDYLNRGGQIIFPLPNFEIYRNKKCALVTGGAGQIGTYMINCLLERDYIVYATYNDTIPKTKKDHRLSFINCDMTNFKHVYNLVKNINPDEIYNFAAKTDTLESFSNELDTYKINSDGVLYLCEAIRLVGCVKKIKLFHANSSELFTGQIDIKETNEFSFPVTPYSISKFNSFLTTKYYREKYGLFICNGFIFNTESPLRRDCYVVKKVINYVKNLQSNASLNNVAKLTIGNLENKKDWIHAYDVSEAGFLILQRQSPDDYNISSGVTHSVEEMISKCFQLAGISDYKSFLESDPTLFRKFESRVENKIGDNSKLKNIGWVQKYQFDEILRDMFNSENPKG